MTELKIEQEMRQTTLYKEVQRILHSAYLDKDQKILVQRLKKTLMNIHSRCFDKRDKHYKYYGGKGIGCILTLDDLVYLWEKNKAYKLLYPSVDRKDSKNHYRLSNCRYIEMAANIGGKRISLLKGVYKKY
jgi:hypothetical protein